MKTKKKFIILAKGFLVLILSYVLGYLSGGFIGEVVLKTTGQEAQLIRSLIIALLNILFLYLFLKVSLFKRAKNWKKTIIVFFTTIVLTLIVNYDNLFQQFRISDMFRALQAGILGEIIFRGVIMSVFLLLFQNSKRPFLWPSLISSVLFTLGNFESLHSGQDDLYALFFQLPFAMSVGLLLSVLFYISQNIFVPILAHLTIDFIYSTSSSFTFLGSNSDLTKASIIRMIVFTAVSIISYLIFYKHFLNESEKSN